ncbi:DUF418 domain-containing protein [Algoriphagus lutimaris]|uniref:DUF418 domain-containing protein n=1 Tax=Algoriphagus lutimaris TaxID=613197 RepID=UPI00196B2DB8|nr:DUF418 domain-containing protein [Algoriphagus lutimaris]MBN3519478.1 DUF418 domain-containing protein [Algoriphagus lutimaris]
MDLKNPINQRIEILDIFRGFAVFGIFVVNIEIMNCAFPNQETFSDQWTSPLDEWTVRLLQLFFYSKFFPIFSFLFGLGISMQAIKLQKNDNLKFLFFGKRMFFLFLLGIAHILFLWDGDVIHLYALLGLLIVGVIPLKNSWILALSILVLVFPYYDPISVWLMDLTHFEPRSFLQVYTSEKITSILRNGPYSESILFRIHNYLANLPLLFSYLGPLAFSMFLLGTYFGKNNLQNWLENFINQSHKPVLWVVVLSNIYRLTFLFILPNTEIYRNEFARPFFFKTMYLSDLAFGLFYLWLLAYIWYKTPWKKLISPLKYPGKMALTNYLMQSIYGLMLFSNIGLGWYEKLSPSQTFLLATSLFVTQLIYSKIWLTYYHFGPLEWLWRCFTYGKTFRLKK